jgi:hypothetical protein
LAFGGLADLTAVFLVAIVFPSSFVYVEADALFIAIASPNLRPNLKGS